jgi:hypothetical protein
LLEEEERRTRSVGRTVATSATAAGWKRRGWR